jgi:hypothetical protein
MEKSKTGLGWLGPREADKINELRARLEAAHGDDLLSGPDLEGEGNC